jgi:acyl-CoA reductase-like NAD-dependent aldehyde dehydrogenase
MATTLVTSWIDGRAVAPGAQRRLPVIDPATEAPVGALLEADAAEVGLAVAAARRAFDDGPWPRLPPAERQTILRRAADLIDARADELARLESLHTGLPIRQVRAMHIPRTALNFRFFADYIGQMRGAAHTDAPGVVTYVARQPIGVAALIAPWNVPLGLGTMKLAAALGFGCTAVLKPSEMTPLSFPLLFDILAEAGLPAGAANLVNGAGPVTGKALSEHPGIDCLSFTGGTATGRMLAAAAGRALKPMTMELGGKSANIVFADCDFEAALDGAVLAAYGGNGQQCLAGSRILVERAIADRFIPALTARVKALKVGPPDDPATEMGPLQNEPHMRRVLGFVDTARAEGCDILAGGARAAGFSSGYYVEPILARASSNAAAICQEEIFGPFATILVVDGPEEAVRIANESAFGLVAYVWTRDIAKALACAEALRTGVVWINTIMMRELRAPFGGWKESGVGREGGDACAALYTQEKTVTIKVGLSL